MPLWLQVIASVLTVVIGILTMRKLLKDDIRADNERQAKLIADRFDAKLETLRVMSDQASKTLGEAARFFKASEDRFSSIEHRLAILEEAWKTTHKLVERVTALDRRLWEREYVCNARHENSVRVLLPHDDDNGGVVL